MKKITFFSAFIFLSVLISYGQWSTTYLSEAKCRMYGAVLGNKAYFAGGMVDFSGTWIDTDKVEIYDMETGQWEMDYLSQARQIVAPASCGGFVFFAGGLRSSNWQVSSRVDIFNSQYYYRETELSVPRFQISAVSNDSLVLFAGGSGSQIYDVVDVYNINTEQWSVDHLSVPRSAMGGAVAGDLAFFAGGEDPSGVSNLVEIYNFTTGTWDTDTLSQARKFIGATVAGNKVIFAGGSISNGVASNRVDIYDYTTDTWTIDSITVARGFYYQSATVCGKAYFVGSGIFDNGWSYGTDTIDVYDPVANTWSIMTLPNKVTENSVVVIDSTLFSAGGFYENNPPYGIALNTVEMYDVQVHVPSVQARNDLFNTYPNPSQGIFHIMIDQDNNKKSLPAFIYNMQGQEVHNEILINGDREMNLQLPAGIYVLKFISMIVCIRN
jgi:hypothetical protein